MLTRPEIKAAARAQIKGKLLTLFLFNLLVALIATAASFTGIGTILVMGPLVLAEVFIYKGLAFNEAISVGQVFDGFKKNFVGSVVTQLVTSLFNALWFFLFIIPGIIKSFSYSMTMYILADNPQLSATEAITESRRMMNGNKMKLFIQELSFIPWILLGVLTLNILTFVYVVPYMASAKYNFYLNLKSADFAQMQTPPPSEFPNPEAPASTTEA